MPIKRATTAVLSALVALTTAFAADRQPTVPAAIAFATYRYVDPATGLEAFRLLIPKGWQAEGAIEWTPDMAMPVRSRFRFRAPGGAEELNFFPSRPRFWTNNSLFLSTNPPGTLRFGTLVERPLDLQTAFRTVVVPGARGESGSWKIVSTERIPGLAELARGRPTPGVIAAAEAGKVRVAYREQGREMEEEFFASVSQFVIRQPASALSAGYFLNYWYIDNIFSFRTEKGKLEASSKVFQTMILSLRINPSWYAKVVNVKEMLAENAIRGIQALGRLGEMIARAGSDLRAEQQRDWEQRQQVQDRISRNFSDHIRGVERFNDTRAGREVELPAGYGNAWSNGLGEYQVSDSPSFNPNLGSSQHWEPLTPVK